MCVYICVTPPPLPKDFPKKELFESLNSPVNGYLLSFQNSLKNNFLEGNIFINTSNAL